MNPQSKRPFYAAALLDPSAMADRNRDFTSLPVAHAGSDEEATSMAVESGKEWLLAHGVDRAILHIVRDGHAFYSEPLIVK